jgi:thiamine pyrophosphate-dependent acetolactate synthase large subunit-like protein
MRVHAALAATLAEHRVTTVFGLMGDANMFLIDTLVRDHDVRYVAAANEAGALLMAAGYASAGGGVGVATVTYGPGLANTLGALVSASRERASVVLITGETPGKRQAHTQRIDHAALVTPTGAGFERACSARTAATDLARALRRAVAERRPIVYSCPVDFTFDDVDGTTEPGMEAVVAPTTSLDPSALDTAVGMIATARRPILLAGAGCVTPDASESLRRLGQTLGAPLMTTLPAKGLFGGDKYDLGVFGSFSDPRAVEAILASDCVIAVGAGLNHLTGGGEGWPYLTGRTVVQCDIDPTVIGNLFPVDAGVVGDATTFADTAVEWLREIEHAASTFRDVAVAGGGGSKPPAMVDQGGTVDLAAALHVLNRVLPANRAVTVDGGRFTAEVIARIDVSQAQAWACSFRGFGAVGNAVSTALGVGCALPAGPTVAVVGDGGFMLGGLAEFNTAVRHGIDLVVVVCNDGSYGAEYRKLQARDVGVETSLFDWPDFAPVASALGGIGLTVRNAADLDLLDTVIARRDRPVLIDFKLDAARVA